MKSSIAILSLLAVGSHAFAPSLHRAQPKTACNLIMSESEITAILDQAHECAEGECAVDDVGDLIVELKSQQKVLSDRLDAIMNAVAHLQAANDAPERKTDDVRALVKDMLRVFSTQKGASYASGYSGDIGSGSTTAYDALPPKPWKAAP